MNTNKYEDAVRAAQLAVAEARSEALAMMDEPETTKASEMFATAAKGWMAVAEAWVAVARAEANAKDAWALAALAADAAAVAASNAEAMDAALRRAVKIVFRCELDTRVMSVEERGRQ